MTKLWSACPLKGPPAAPASAKKATPKPPGVDSLPSVLSANVSPGHRLTGDADTSRLPMLQAGGGLQGAGVAPQVTVGLPLSVLKAVPQASPARWITIRYVPLSDAVQPKEQFAAKLPVVPKLKASTAPEGVTMVMAGIHEPAPTPVHMLKTYCAPACTLSSKYASDPKTPIPIDVKSGSVMAHVVPSKHGAPPALFRSMYVAAAVVHWA